VDRLRGELKRRAVMDGSTASQITDYVWQTTLKNRPAGRLPQRRPRLGTVDEAADLLKIPRSSVYKLAQQGKIPTRKVGRHRRFRRLTLVNWIADAPINASLQVASGSKPDE
jgi:excisionase family DNA binding protein